jgi:hypothetical protein
MRYAAITLATILSLTGSFTVAQAFGRGGCDAACQATYEAYCIATRSC